MKVTQATGPLEALPKVSNPKVETMPPSHLRAPRFSVSAAPHAFTPPFYGRTLVVVAHPDDELIGCGALMTRLGDVEVVHVTNGAPTDPAYAQRRGFASPAAYAKTRAGELGRALKVAGVPLARAHRLEVSDQGATAALVDISARILPFVAQADTVLTHAFEGGHPDHDAVAFAVHAAVRLSGRPGTRIYEMPLYHLDAAGETVRQRFVPGPGAGVPFSLALTDAERALKDVMAACHASQAATITRFDLGRDIFRRAPTYDFEQLPNDGRLLHGRYGSGVDAGEAWRAAAQTAAVDLGFARRRAA